MPVAPARIVGRAKDGVNATNCRGSPPLHAASDNPHQTARFARRSPHDTDTLGTSSEEDKIVTC